jgi:CDGSH-type Zn-finger protein
MTHTSALHDLLGARLSPLSGSSVSVTYTLLERDFVRGCNPLSASGQGTERHKLRYNEATAQRAEDLGRKRMAQVKITVRRNGPFRVEAPEGSVELVDADGTPYDLTGKPAFSLCRCGGSVNKPFCDGTHSKIGFQAAEAAVKNADEATPEQPKS